MSRNSSADILLGSLKNLQKESRVVEEKSKTVGEPSRVVGEESSTPTHSTIALPDPHETSVRMRQFFEQSASSLHSTSSQPTPAQPHRVVVQKGEDFVVEVREKRNMKKNFLMPASLSDKLAQEAKELGISQNELINQILRQRYS